jgi:hypothetical protein
MHYDLWDVETGNYLGRYATEEEALAVVRALIEQYGDGYADDLNLGAEDDAGSFSGPLSGSALLARVAALAVS